MVHYSMFDKTEDTAFNILKALNYCKVHGEDGLLFDKGTYCVKREKAAETEVSVSNHCGPGVKRACFLLDGFRNFTIDGGGSSFIFEDILFPVLVRNAENVTVKNFTFSSENTQNMQALVTDSGEDWFEMQPETNLPVFVIEKDVYVGDRDGEHQKLRCFDEVDGATNRLVPHAGDYFFCYPQNRIDFEMLSNGNVKATGVKRKIKAGNRLNFASMTRAVANIFIDSSKNTTVQDVTLFSGIGMGMIAQNSDTVTAERFSTRLADGRSYSINADGTHFVHCKGKIAIRDCFFEGQLDDALNVHSVYLKIEEKTERTLLLRFMHVETKGIDLIPKGGMVEIADASTLLPYETFKVESVRRINGDYVEITVDKDTSAVRIGDVANEVSFVPEILFENCTVRNNRARGMLLASAGKTVIRGNLFQTPGCSIKFESDGKYWFESGGVKDVLITENRFENCCYADWGEEVIYTQPREKEEENRFYHGKIEVSGNAFVNCSVRPATINNVETLIFKNNTFENCADREVKFSHCGTAEIK